MSNIIFINQFLENFKFNYTCLDICHKENDFAATTLQWIIALVAMSIQRR